MGLGRRRPGLYADIPVPVLQVPAKEEGGPRDLQNLLKEEEKEEGEEEKKEDGDDEEEWEEKRRDELQGSLVVEKGMILNSPWYLLPLVSFPCSSCFKVLSTFHLLRHHITWHSPSYPVCPNTATTVARTFQDSPTCLNMYWLSMETAVPQKYCKTDI